MMNLTPRKTDLVAIQMELTNNCLCACAECPRELSMTRPVGNMDLDLAKLIVDDALSYNPNCGFNLNGLGEPLLYKWMPELITHIGRSGGKHIDFFTSLKAPDKLVDPVIEALKEVQTNTMMAITKHIYDVDGGDNLDLEQFERHFRKCLELPPPDPETRVGTEIHMGLVANRFHSLIEIEEFRRYYRQFLPDDRVHVTEQLNGWFGTVTDQAHPHYGASPPTLTPQVCEYPFILLHVGWNGDCLICCADDVAGKLVLGKIEQPGDVQRVWESDLYRDIRDKHNRGDVNGIPACNECERTAFARTEGALTG